MNSVFCWLLATWKMAPGLGLCRGRPVGALGEIHAGLGCEGFSEGFLGTSWGLLRPRSPGNNPLTLQGSQVFHCAGF